ncbi:MAG TPA: hypothetical protein VFP54_09455 [Acidimicrobiales bacterium]|nr:hypothetical protein [Acidimicrobiales bacterium]
MPDAADTRQWVSFPDQDEMRTWMFDVTFLLSRWTCVFGQGCQGVLTDPAPELVQGCCSYGAHFTDDEDVARVEAAAATLTAEDWQHHRRGRRGVTKKDRSGATVTRMVDDACVFLNRPGFPGGPGCALHRAAVERGVHPMTMKPDVCWQLPLRREDFGVDGGHVFSVVGPWDRRHWGGGGFEFAWWCTEAEEAFTGASAVYRSLGVELEAMVGAPVYARLVEYLDALVPAPGTPVAAPTRSPRRRR